MTNLRLSHNNSFLLYFLVAILNFTNASQFVQAQNILGRNPSNSSVSAIFVFGDSTVDPGNNNYIPTTFKSNFPPYGESFVNRMPTGRFSDGRLATDYIASYLGIKEYVPPYLDSTLSIDELMTGVSFASAGSGYDPLTAQLSNVIEMTSQVEYFKKYKSRMEGIIGKKQTLKIIRKAVFVISAGTNDFVINYFTVPLRRQSFSVYAYQLFLIQHVRTFIEALWSHGARKFAIAGLPPMGCLPVVITLNSNNMFLKRGCIDSYSSAATDYNYMLQKELKSLQNSLARHRGTKIFYIDIYNPVNEMIQSGHQFGFDVVSSGCCGTGLLETSFMCNLKSRVCPNVAKYVFWDSIHPTEKTYYLLFNSFVPIIDSIIRD